MLPVLEQEKQNSNINFKRSSCLEYFNTPNHIYGTRIIFKLSISLQILYYGSPRVLNLSCLFLLFCNHFPTNYLSVRHVRTFSHQHALREDVSSRTEQMSWRVTFGEIPMHLLRSNYTSFRIFHSLL